MPQTSGLPPIGTDVTTLLTRGGPGPRSGPSGLPPIGTDVTDSVHSLSDIDRQRAWSMSPARDQARGARVSTSTSTAPVAVSLAQPPPSVLSALQPNLQPTTARLSRAEPSAVRPVATARDPMQALQGATGIGAGPPPPSASAHVENAVRALGAGGLTFNATLVWPALQAAGDLLGLPSVSAWGRTLSAQADALTAKTRGLQAGASDTERAIYSGVESIGSNVPALVLGAMTGQPEVALGLMGNMTAGQAYANARKAGVAPVKALTHAVSQGLVEIATEKIPVGRLLGDLAQNTGIWKTLMRQVSAELPGEQVATLLQDLNDWATLHPERTPAQYLAERPSAATQTLIATIVGTIGQAGGALALDRLTKSASTQPARTPLPGSGRVVTPQPAGQSPDSQDGPLPPGPPQTEPVPLAVQTEPPQAPVTPMALRPSVPASTESRPPLQAEPSDAAVGAMGLQPIGTDVTDLLQQIDAALVAPSAETGAEAPPAPIGQVASPAETVRAEPSPTAPTSPIAVLAEGMEPQPGQYYLMAPKDIAVDSARFQFKAGSNAQGVTARDRIEGPWQEARAGTLMVWRDPADGRTYVINGHNRLDAATRRQVPRVAVRYLDVQDAASARVEGALTNIAEDKGTPLDAAKVIRETGRSTDELVAAGMSLRSALFRDGSGLARLSDPLFARVASGELSEQVGGAVGSAALSPEGQAAVVKLVLRQQAKGRTLTPAQVRTLAEDVAQTPEVQSAGAQTDIFGLLGDERTQSVAVEKAVLRDWVRGQLAKDKRLFGFVAKAGRAEDLARGGNVIDVGQSQQLAEEASTVGAAFDRLVQATGPVSDALNQAAAQTAAGKAPPHEIRTALLDNTRAAVAQELGRSAGPLASAERRRAGGPPASAPSRPITDPQTVDRLPSGEAQPRLPEAGRVREQNIPTPQVAEAPFSLIAEADTTPRGTHQSLFADAAVKSLRIATVGAPASTSPSAGSQASAGAFDETAPVRAGALPDDRRGGLFGAPVPVRAGASPGAIYPIEFPEMVAFISDLLRTPRVVTHIRKGGVLGQFKGDQGIILLADLFKQGNERQLSALLAHEIGHALDWLPDATISRGNILGRLRSLHRFMKGSFTAADGFTVKATVVRTELKALSQHWRPWDETAATPKEKSYRHSSRELYADAISVLFNNPGLLETTAPTFYRQFFEDLDTKPEAKLAYFELHELLSGTRDELIVRRRERVQAGALLGETKALDLQRAKIAERAVRKGSAWFNLRVEYYDKNTPISDFVTAAKKRGVVVPEDEDPRYMLSERNYLGGKMKAAAEEFVQPIRAALQEAEIPWMTLHEGLLYERIVSGDRSEFANPEGLSPASAAELLADVRGRLSPEQNTVLTKAIGDLRGWVKGVARQAHQVGLLTDAQMTQIEANAAYAPFRVVEHIEAEVSWRIYKQRGTLKSVSHTGDAAIIKTLATIRAIERQKMLVGTFDFMTKHEPTAITQAEERWNGKTLAPVEPPPQAGVEIVRYYDRGRLRGKLVDPYVANSLNNLSVGQNSTVVRALSFLNSNWFRPVFTTLNVGFQTKNFSRDLQRGWKTRPDATLGAILKSPFIMAKYYVKGAPLARARAFGLPLARRQGPPIKASRMRAAADLREAEKAGILGLTWNDLMRGRDVADTEIDQIAGKVGIGPSVPPPFRHGLVATPIGGAVRLARFIEEVGNFIETLPKAAAIYEYKGDGSIADISPAQRAFIREKVGSPDFRAAGTNTPISNNLLLFSNAFVHGTGSDLEVMRGINGPGGRGPGGQGYGPGVGPEGPTTSFGYWWKTAFLNVAPKLAAFAALYLIAEPDDPDSSLAWWRRGLRSVSEYDMTNFLPIPFGIDDQGNVSYWRQNQDDTGRLIGGLTWKALQFARRDKAAMTSVLQVLDYGAGQFPGVMPALSTASDLSQFATGGKVYDPYRDRFLFTDDEARDTDIGRKAKKFFGYEFQQLGGGVVWKFYPGEQRPQALTTGQKILEWPLLSSVSGGWVKVSHYGEIEKLRETGHAVQGAESTKRLDEREAVNVALRTYLALPTAQQIPAAQERSAREVALRFYAADAPIVRAAKARDILKKIRMGAIRGSADPLTEAVMGTTSNAQKIAMIQQAAKGMASGAFAAWLRRAIQEKIVSGDVVAAVTATKRTPPGGRSATGAP